MKLYAILFLIMIICTGCARPPVEEPPQELQETMKRSREIFDAVKQLQVYETYVHDFQEAQNDLINAENHFRENRYDQALSSARKSLAASQRILRQFYQDTVAQSAQEAKTRIEAITNEDPGNPLQEFLPQLDEILSYSEEIESTQLEIEKILEDLDNVTKIGQNTQKTMKKTLGSDVSFDPGKYDLSDKGKHILETYCKDIIASKREFNKLYPDRTIIIKVTVFGYTDQVDFLPGTELVKKLIEGVEDEVPRTQSERRKFLNQRLSEFRARTVSNYIVQCIAQENPTVHIEQENIGYGEEIPPDIPPPYPTSDPRRRICKIFSYVLVQ